LDYVELLEEKSIVIYCRQEGGERIYYIDFFEFTVASVSQEIICDLIRNGKNLSSKT